MKVINPIALKIYMRGTRCDLYRTVWSNSIYSNEITQAERLCHFDHFLHVQHVDLSVKLDDCKNEISDVFQVRKTSNMARMTTEERSRAVGIKEAGTSLRQVRTLANSLFKCRINLVPRVYI